MYDLPLAPQVAYAGRNTFLDRRVENWQRTAGAFFVHAKCILLSVATTEEMHVT